MSRMLEPHLTYRGYDEHSQFLRALYHPYNLLNATVWRERTRHQIIALKEVDQAVNPDGDWTLFTACNLRAKFSTHTSVVSQRKLDFRSSPNCFNCVLRSVFLQQWDIVGSYRSTGGNIRLLRWDAETQRAEETSLEWRDVRDSNNPGYHRMQWLGVNRY